MYPLTLQTMKEIQELIRKSNVQQNMEMAMEYNPESFGRVIMLYIPVKINGVTVKAFVDSGAQVTIMSAKCAEKCGLLRLIDERYRGTLKGVGTSESLGRIHATSLNIGNANIPCSMTVSKGMDIEFLLGYFHFFAPTHLLFFSLFSFFFFWCWSR